MKHLLRLFSILIATNFIHCIEESFCAGTGHLDGNGRSNGAKSMGWTKFEKNPYSRVFGGNHANVDPADKPLVSMDIQKVEEPERGANGEMNGWLQLNIKGNALNFVVLAVWAVTDTRESIGEFVSTRTAKCASIPKVEYTDENIVPCAAAPVNEPVNPNMFVYVDTKKVGGLKEINLLWRTSVSYCNFPKKFRFMIAANTKIFAANLPSFKLTERKYGPRIYASKWISPRFYGPAAAPLFDSTKLKCSTSIKDSKPQWIKSISATGAPTDGGRELVEVEREWTDDRWTGTNPIEDRDTVDKRRGCKPEYGTYAFAGRCTTKVGPKGAKVVSATALHICDTNDNFEASDLSVFQGTYEDHLKKREKTLRENCDCPPIPSVEEVRRVAGGGGSGRKKRSLNVGDADVEEEDDDEPFDAVGRVGNGDGNEIDPPVREYAENLLAKCYPIGVSNGSFTKDEQGLCANSQPGKMSYGVRQWHAVSILFCVVVLNPVTSYMARFLKGTFTFTGRAPIPIKTWYIVHIAIVLPMVCMYTTGMAAIFRQRPVLGYSYSNFATLHRLGGYLLFVIGFFEIVTGIVRPRNLALRKIVIALHWLGGVLTNHIGLILCILTYRIPASPTSFVPHVNRKKFESIWSHMAPLILSFWGILDILYQLTITCHVLNFDRKFGISRSHFPILIPFLVDRHQMRIHDEFETEESFQKGAFTMYVILAFVTYLLTCIAIYSFNSTFNEQSYGPMFCSHNRFGVFLDPHVKPKSYWYC